MSGWYDLSKRAVDRHKGSHVRALLARNDADLAAEFQAARQADHQQYQALRKNARVVMMAYYNALRVEGWIGDLALVIEHELFAEDSLKVKLRDKYGPHFDGLAV